MKMDRKSEIQKEFKALRKELNEIIDAESEAAEVAFQKSCVGKYFLQPVRKEEENYWYLYIERWDEENSCLYGKSFYRMNNLWKFIIDKYISIYEEEENIEISKEEYEAAFVRFLNEIEDAK